MSDTKDYRNRDGPGTMCDKYKETRNGVKPKKDTIPCEHEVFDRYHKSVCKFYDYNSAMCRK